MAAATAFQKKLATTCMREYDRFHLLREYQQPLSSQIATYWRDLGMAAQPVSVAWSAVFVSWCVKQAGATKSEFKFSARHSSFVHAAIANATANTGVFRGHPITDYAPKIGDILQNNRSGNTFDFNYARTHNAYESHSAIVMEVGLDNKGRYLRTIGGNEGDSVGMRELRLDAKGFLKVPPKSYIAVIETLK